MYNLVIRVYLQCPGLESENPFLHTNAGMSFHKLEQDNCVDFVMKGCYFFPNLFPLDFD